ncbi:Transposase IS4 [Popillia japonica]|uniref:Transposase IS4 n=1 Tax=Popillia japonica TaxID=7064 RepID=A0AAW1NAB1_POPJA
MDKLKIEFINNWIPEENLDFDESMIKYYGRNLCVFIRGKPIRFGYKMWCLDSPSGYLINFGMYQAKIREEMKSMKSNLENVLFPFLLSLMNFLKL